MQFKKINDLKFQVILNKDDMNNFNLTMEDFFGNNTNKIHSLLDTLMERPESRLVSTWTIQLCLFNLYHSLIIHSF